MKVKITPKEFEVVKLLIKGLSNYEIAHTMNISTHVVKEHITSLFIKFDVKNRTELAYILGKNNII